jgi:flagellin-specific chaperone FliS
MTDELVPQQPEPFAATPELKAAIEAAIKGIQSKSYSERHQELGKMIKCQVCGRRHRASEIHEQVFTYRVKDYELFREDENGKLVPDFRTAIRPDTAPTKRQVVGAAAFAKKRLKPHHSAVKLQFIERVRRIFTSMGFSLDDEGESFQANLKIARKKAIRQLRKEHRTHRRITNRSREVPGRIERGLEWNGTR